MRRNTDIKLPSLRGRFAPLNTPISFLKKETKIFKSGTFLNAHFWYIFKRPLTQNFVEVCRLNFFLLSFS